MAHFNITDGPSKFDLMVALFDGDCRHRRMVRFSLEDPEASPKYGDIPDHEFVINGFTREDGSGESWNFTGYYPGSSQGAPCKGTFSTQIRKGWIEF